VVKAGGWESPVDLGVLHRLISERPDQTTGELTRAYNRVTPNGRVHRSSIWRALRRTGYVFKKTLAARGAGPDAGPSRADGVPRVGPDGRDAAVGLSR
jgi:hypothetical protein